MAHSPSRITVHTKERVDCTMAYWSMEDRAGPAVRNDDWQRVRVLRADVDEMNVQSIDLGDELWQGVQPRLHLAPVVFRRPVARDVLH